MKEICASWYPEQNQSSTVESFIGCLGLKLCSCGPLWLFISNTCDHPRGIVSVAVCLYVITIIFESLDTNVHWSAAISPWDTCQVHYEDHRVNVKITAAKKREIPYSRNAKLQLARTHFLLKTEPWNLHVADRIVCPPSLTRQAFISMWQPRSCRISKIRQIYM